MFIFVNLYYRMAKTQVPVLALKLNHLIDQVSKYSNSTMLWTMAAFLHLHSNISIPSFRVTLKVFNDQTTPN